jgi:oligopeptide/dipeptide ABC transporter ATP-binding protein
MSAEGPVLQAIGLHKRFPIGNGRKAVHAVNGVDFDLRPGEILGLVGESGSGKSTVGRLALGLLEPDEGEVRFLGAALSALSREALRRHRAHLQVVFQDPWGALNPRLRIRTLIEEPLKLHLPMSAAERRQRVHALCERVRLGDALLDRHPSELSGGQLQRVCIARALATDPRVIVLDEPTSSLDLSVRAGILDLLVRLRDETGVAMLLITHDLGTLRLVADRVKVLYLGRVVEAGPAARVLDAPEHPYTQALMSASLSLDPGRRRDRIILKGEVPSPVDLPAGCGFAARCPVAIDACHRQRPALDSIGAGGEVACLRLPEGGNRIPPPPAIHQRA